METPTIPIAMKADVTPKAFRSVEYPTFSLALYVLLGLDGMESALKLFAAYPIQITSGCAAMILVIEFVGIPQRIRLLHFGVGILFAFSLFLTGVLSVCVSAMLVEGDFDLIQYLVWPVLFYGAFGILPAALFGLLGTGILRMTRKTLPSGEPSKAMPTRIPHFKP